MSKVQSKRNRKSINVKLVGSPEKMIDLLILGDKERKWVENQVVNHGSKHKRVLTALLLIRLLKLVQTIEKKGGAKFAMQEGFELTVDVCSQAKVDYWLGRVS